MHSNESSWKENGKLQWVWAFRASDFSVFQIDSHRSYDVLCRVLGNAFSGIVSCDFYSAYKKLESQTAAKL
ncbi:MAG: transposase [Planctomycetaceae bacterium]|nr:transposase [Planctomycetaceae bacterium]